MADNLALTRIEKLLDEGSFVEIGALVSAKQTDFSLKNYGEASDGVITGYGLIDSNPVFVYSQNRDVLGGTLGEMHAKKIAGIYDRARQKGAPVIGFIDCGGFRLQESVDALAAFGELLTSQTLEASDRLQICGVFGNCAGGLSVIPALSDFTFMTKNANMFINSPQTITDDPKLAKGFSSWEFQSGVSGNAEVCESEDEAIGKIRKLVIMLSEDDYGCCGADELNRLVTEQNPESLDTRLLISEIADNREFIEYRPEFCPEMITGIMRINGLRVAVMGNAPDKVKGLTAGGCIKAAEFLNVAIEANLPVLNIAAAEGFEPVSENERMLARALSELIRKFSRLEGGKVNLIAGNVYGSVYSAIVSAPDPDATNMTFAWNNVKVGMMEAEKAVGIMFAEDENREKALSDYEKTQNSIYSAAARGCVDAVINPAETRKHLIMAFSI
ncbi:MAG: carboxyl transferase [Eubacterium sp.]|nr:carboxyl transferase [Eubacterium sp.]